MNPRDRYLACMRGDPVDRVPLSLEGLQYDSRDALAAEPDAPRRAVAERICDHTHFWVNVASHINRYMILPSQFMRRVDSETTAGGVVETTEISTPRGPLRAIVGRNDVSRTSWTIKYPVESLDDIDKMRSVEWELPEGLVAPDAGDLTMRAGERGVVRTAVSSPFVTVAGMMPYQYFLELCITEFDLMRDLTQLCMERTLSVLDVLLTPGAVEYVWMGGCEWLTPPMASPRLYEELVQRFEEPVIRRIHQGGAVSHVHCHGNVRSTIESVVARGADYFEPVEPPPDGDITMAEAKRVADGRMSLGGNVEARLLEKGSREDVERATRAAFEGGGERMVLTNTAGPISALDERTAGNYHAMVDVWEELSKTRVAARAAAASVG